MIFPNIGNLKRRREVGRRWGLLSKAAWKPREPDYETLRYRALHDRKGKVIREGATFTALGETHWQVRHSAGGRTDQLDLVANGTVAKTCGSRRMPRRFRPDKHR